jgi:stage V sporulation protein R
MFHIHDDPEEKAGVRVNAIHDERGYRRMRRELSRRYDVGFVDPNIEIVDVDLAGDRRLILRHGVVNGALLHENDAKLVLQHLATLWTYDVLLQEVDATGAILKELAASPRSPASTLQ